MRRPLMEQSVCVCVYIYIYICIEIRGRVDRYLSWSRSRQAGRQTGRQADRQTRAHIHTLVHTYRQAGRQTMHTHTSECPETEASCKLGPTSGEVALDSDQTCREPISSSGHTS